MNSDVEEILFKYRWYLLAGILGFLLILFGIVASSRQLPFFAQDKIEILGEESGGGEIVVEVGGAIEKPGVYKMSAGGRVDEVLIAAGGLSAQADREWVNRTLNRAAKLTDGQKIFIPDKNQISQPKAGPALTENVKSEQTSGLVNVNTASQAELEALPGIGPVTAGKIIGGRPYSDVGELLSRKILPKKVFEENKEKLSVW